MDEAASRQYILETFEGVEVTDLSGDSFFFTTPHASSLSLRS